MSLKKNLEKRNTADAPGKEEKRREPRVNENAGIMVEIAAAGKMPKAGQKYPVWGKNISAGGMKISCGSEFPKGTRLHIKFLSCNPGRSIQLQGKIKWIKRHADEQDVEMGLEFLNVSLVDYIQLLDHIYKKK